MDKFRVRVWDFYGDGKMAYCNGDRLRLSELMGESDHKDLMLYIGLVDKFKTDVYEGDIIVREDGLQRGQVVFHDGGFVVSWHGGKSFERLYQRLLRHFWVAGNIYENPERLERG